MICVAEAFDKLLATVMPKDVEQMPLDRCLGLVLATDVVSSFNSPPFDKALMDGYAVHAGDVKSGTAKLRVVEVVTAGRVATIPVAAGQATQIMTGAPLPVGADAVIKIEETTRDGDWVEISTSPVNVGLNLIRRGTSIQSGDQLLAAGTVLNASRIGALAEIGLATIPVRDRPQVAILATGDELVPFDQTPGPGQIRNSNEAMLSAQIESMGAVPVPLGIARDNPVELHKKIEVGLQNDVLILSGGVSAGTLDLVPKALAECGVNEVFHKVELKPGKPIWFGVRSIPNRRPRYVFGLPGNPVGSMVCCELFVRTAIRRLMGMEPAVPTPQIAKLEHEHTTKADRPTYHPAKLTRKAQELFVSLVPWHGSSDLCGTVDANGMAFFPGHAGKLKVGDQLEVYYW